MKCRRDLWTKALALCKHATDAKSSIPALAYLTIEASGGRAVLRACDLTRWLRIQFPCEGDLPLMSFDARTITRVSNAAKKTRGEMMSVEAVESGCILHIGGRKFEIDRDGSPKDRPKDRELSGNTSVQAWDASTFSRALDYVIPASSRDETRFHLASVALIDDKLITTDGHRLHIVDGVPSFDGTETLLDRDTAVACQDAIKQCEPDYVMGRLWTDSKTIELSIEGPKLDVLILAKPLEAQFPPYQQVVPSHKLFYAVESEALRESTATALKLIKAKGDDPGIRGMSLHANGDLRVATDSGFREVLSLTKPCAAKSESKVGVNPSYVIDALKGVDGTVQIHYGSDLDPMAIQSGDRIAVVMPMRI